MSFNGNELPEEYKKQILVKYNTKPDIDLLRQNVVDSANNPKFIGFFKDPHKKRV